MSRNMFVYTRTIQVPKENGEKETKELKQVFNINKVIRADYIIDEKTLTVVLDDFHQRKEEVPIYNKAGRETGKKNETGTFQSNIHLSGSDIERFFKQLTIEE